MKYADNRLHVGYVLRGKSCLELRSVSSCVAFGVLIDTVSFAQTCVQGTQWNIAQ
jgi:hypothetical protein